MVDTVSTNLLDQVKFQKANINAHPKQAEQSSSIKNEQQQDVASSGASAAAMAYVSPMIKYAMPETSAEYVEKLKNSGKVEGKDFRIEKEEGKYTDVIELDSNGRMVKTNAWSLEEGKEKPLGTEDIVYRNDGRILYRDARYPYGKIEHHAHHYYNDEIPQTLISHDGVTFETKVEDYIKDLQAKGTKYTEQVEEDSTGLGKSHIVEEYTSDGKRSIRTVWVELTKEPEKNHVYRDLFNADESVSTSILFDKEKSVVVNFFK